MEGRLCARQARRKTQNGDARNERRLKTRDEWEPLSGERVTVGIAVRVREVQCDRGDKDEDASKQAATPVMVIASQEVRVRGRIICNNTVHVTPWSAVLRLGTDSDDANDDDDGDAAAQSLMSSPASSFYQRHISLNKSAVATPEMLRIDSLRATRAVFSWTLNASTSLVAGFLLDKISIHIQCAPPRSKNDARTLFDEDCSKPPSNVSSANRWQNFMLESCPKMDDGASTVVRGSGKKFRNDGVVLLGLREGSSYRLRVRVVRTRSGLVGPWSQVLRFATPRTTVSPKAAKGSSKRTLHRRRSSGIVVVQNRHRAVRRDAADALLSIATHLRVVSVTQTSARVVWRCDRPCEFQLQYAKSRILSKWTDFPAFVRASIDPSSQVSSRGGQTTATAIAQVVVGSLAPATTYVCRVRARGRGSSNFGAWTDSVKFRTIEARYES